MVSRGGHHQSRLECGTGKLRQLFRRREHKKSGFYIVPRFTQKLGSAFPLVLIKQAN
ncbi:MAG: hypothetical protein KatS3mg019_2585 [Fimbriimonadales bacterium]|nr:MAG: hypothetical protein KatS3mg019_2585 [Fimbriimonadales bacterium]